MAKHIGGTAVKAGFYWNLRKWEMVTLSGIGGTLPGTSEDRYLKVPILGFLVIAPLMGGLYAFFLPFIGFAMVFAFLGRKLGTAGRAAVARVGGLVSPDWAPGEAYLAGKRGKKRGKESEKDEAANDKTEDA
ncbi:MAG: hypothetical protein ACM3NQ_25185 [Bacteroidales bacterium]